MPRTLPQNLLLLAFTAVFIGYLSVWLPGPAAGLSFLGIELGEWLKFMGVGLERNLFYLPPITLALMLVAWTLPWENGRWQTWAMRGVAILISLLVFPALEDMTGPTQQEYWPRVGWIGLVVVMVGVTAVLGWTISRESRDRLCWLVLAVLAIVGLVQPTRVYLQIQPDISRLFGLPVGFGWGLLLNGVGFLLVAGVSVWKLSKK
jgi:hypothetical protein